MDTPNLSHMFADQLPELTVPWQAESAPSPQLLVLNEPLAQHLGLDVDWLRSTEGLEFLLGHRLPEDAQPVAMAYSGHQFGQFSPRLGDGRALLLGEITDVEGQLHDLHLKGSGPTPFSRGGDGRGAVGPMLREYLLSEAMAALGVPTTRALAVVTTGRRIQRGQVVPGAVLVRVADSHLRVGTMQYARMLDGDNDLLARLADQVIDRHYPELAQREDKYLALAGAIMDTQTATVARWMRLGFVHGVMNTDNTTLSGETIDYGPCAFLDSYDLAEVYSSIDQQGRYAFGNQPGVLGWNLARLAESMLPLFHEDPDQALSIAQDLLDSFDSRSQAAASRELAFALDVPEDAREVIAGYQALLAAHSGGNLDLTRFQRSLVTAAAGEDTQLKELLAADTKDTAGTEEQVDQWLNSWLTYSPSATRLGGIHPSYIPRNHLVEEALSLAQEGDLSAFHQLLEVVTHPFDEQLSLTRYAHPAPADFGPYRTFCGT
ncbi:protein adenylyltransferase SelO [Corynebacterium alimapuense]|uniref:Protein nucleotidyltransferase YdiU n=1 Tax=Corynebacterium alimapuense TaxID=1576874 RepID=A0A3M8K846_9CORY|nr:YdiU family protein [Corynebacterium alimapuense]RNE49393.1 YdiU family protein [Corynebacterium alimapuense]